MRRIALLFTVFTLVMSACSSSKKIATYETKNKTVADKIVANAVAFKGTKYKFGGTTSKGMDCSGVVFVAYKKENVALPRVSIDMSNHGKKVSLNKAEKGDLLFFRTSKSNRKINHVGLITSVHKGEIKFIHATTSRGVIISSLTENYWNKAFVKAVKVL